MSEAIQYAEAIRNLELFSHRISEPFWLLFLVFTGFIIVIDDNELAYTFITYLLAYLG